MLCVDGGIAVVGHASDTEPGKCGDVAVSGKRFGNREYTDGFGRCNVGIEWILPLLYYFDHLFR
jgi:hypothetical protein